MKKYNTPEVEIEMFDVTDVIVASGGGDLDCSGDGCPIAAPDIQI